ncbi:MAG: alpha/beta fold hydrolase [Wenzhouxiangellaceae bacterium]
MILPRQFKLPLFVGLQLALVALFGLAPAHASEADNETAIQNEVAIEFEAQSGEIVEAFQGQFEVPSNWHDLNGDILTLSYVRFPSTGVNAGSPIVYLAGGPGGSGSATARGRRFPLFMAMREFGDVVAFDQRGTGNSSRPPGCTSGQTIDDGTRYSDKEFVGAYRAAADECLAQWTDQGIRPQDWTTLQSVGDLDALRRHLRADKINLWGISYGSHLALAALKEMDNRIERVILASVEGLDQTVKRPSETDAYFNRLQDAINTRPKLREQFPDIVGLIQRVHEMLDAEPVMVQVIPGDGEAYDYLLETRDMRFVSSMMIADPGFALRLLDLYRALDAGSSEPPGRLLADFHTQNQPFNFAVMPLFMDLASGIDADALRQFEEESQTALLGTILNFPMPHLHDVVPGLDLGATFRQPPESEVPTLVLTGTLDGRTYPDSQLAAVSGLANAEIVMIENAGHNLFMTNPAVTERIQAFMRGATGTSKIHVESWAR